MKLEMRKAVMITIKALVEEPSEQNQVGP